MRYFFKPYVAVPIVLVGFIFAACDWLLTGAAIVYVFLALCIAYTIKRNGLKSENGWGALIGILMVAALYSAFLVPPLYQRFQHQEELTMKANADDICPRYAHWTKSELLRIPRKHDFCLRYLQYGAADFRAYIAGKLEYEGRHEEAQRLLTGNDPAKTALIDTEATASTTTTGLWK